MIRVLHVVHTMECGGIETMLMNVYRKINKDNIQFDFLVNGKKDCYYTKEIENLGGNVLNVTPKRDNFFKNIKETIYYMKKGGYSIVHIHQDSMIAPAIWCAKKAGIKFIFTHAHTTSVDGWYRKLATYFGRFYIEKNAYLKFACSDAAANWIYGKKSSDHVIFKNAIDANKYSFSEENYINNRIELGIKRDDFVVGTCGRLSVEKNQKFLVEIFAKIKKMKPNSRLLLIGDGPEKGNLINIATELGVINDVVFTGMVSNVDYYYSILDCFVLPSFYEGLPLVGIEAQAAGITCFFSKGVTEEVKVTDDVYFLNLDDGDDVWCKKIIECCSSRKKTYSMIKNSGYDIGANVDLLENMYLSCYENHKER